MRHVLDSHALLWYTLADPKLSGTAKGLILDPANEILISPASYWEIAIKVSIGKLTLHQPYQDFIDVCLNKYGFTILSSHTTRAKPRTRSLPRSRHRLRPTIRR